MSLINRLSYRPDIDGLRAIAVITVVLFHAGMGCPGGYVGVDVFFVISGFLITSLVWHDLETNHFTFGHFWERRARRIVPAQFVATIATLIAGLFILLPADLASLGKAAGMQALLAANIYYWRDSGYFAAASDEKPLLHTWSLAVEEQYYLVAPFVLWGLYRLTWLRRRSAVLTILIAAAALSFACSVYLVRHHPWAAFFILPSRAWEMLLGSIIAFVPAMEAVGKRRYVKECGSIAGLLAILTPVFTYTKETDFPGLTALSPCLGTALIIWSNGTTTGTPATLTSRLLSLRPVVFIGLISYSLYLWHWPLIAYQNYLSLEAPGIFTRVITMVAGLLLAILSWRFVETPFRVRNWGRSRVSMYLYAAAGLAAMLVCGVALSMMKGVPSRFPARTQEIANAKNDQPPFRDLTTDSVRKEQLSKLGASSAGQPPTAMVWGDSHARAVLTAFDSYFNEEGTSATGATRSATAPVLGWYSPKKTAGGPGSLEYNDAIMSYIQKHHIQDVFLVARWSFYQDESGHYPQPFIDSLLETIKQLHASGSRPWVVLDVPNHSFDVPRALARFSHALDNIPSMIPTTAGPLHDGFSPEVLKAIEEAGGRIIDPKPAFVDPQQQRYVLESDGQILYYDSDHLTTQGARLFFLPFLRTATHSGAEL